MATWNERMARRKANRWLIDNLGNMVMAADAVLIEGDSIPVWRFDAVATAATHEPIGLVGHVDVDARTGEVLSDEHQANMIFERSQEFTRPEKLFAILNW